MSTKWTKEKQAEYYKEWRIKNKDKLKTYQKNWHKENKEYIQAYLSENDEHIKKVQKEYRENNSEKIKELWREWYKNNPERSPKRRFAESKNKAIKKRELTWTITIEEYTELIQLPCYYCDNKLGQPVKRSCGLDRIDSNVGYEINNVVSCCFICNTIKHEHLNVEETKAAVNAILAVRASKL